MSLPSKNGDDLANVASVPSEDEHYSNRTSFHSLDESYYQNKPLDAATSGKLLFWPPIQAYKVLDDGGVFQFSSVEGAGIYAANIECRKALETSAFVEFMHSIGITTHSRSKTAEAQILVYIKPALCEQPESFELQVRPNKIILIAADGTGVLYALLALKDLLSFSAESVFENDAKVVRLPALLMSDAPRVRTRAVHWSYQYQVFASARNPASSIRFLTTLKINTIFLHLDRVFDLYDDGADAALVSISNELFLLHDLAKTHGIRVVPTVVLTTTDREQLADVLHLLHLPLWQQALLVVDFSANPSAATGNNTSMKQKEDALRTAYIQTLESLREATVRDILVTVHPSVAHAVQVDNVPENLQGRLSVTVLDYGAYQAEPLRRKPLVLMREVVESMVTHVERLLVSGAVGAADVVVLPLHTEKDFLAPELLQKYVLTLFSALTSFGPRMVEFFASPQRFAQIARPLARLLQLSHCSVVANDRSLSTSDAKTRSHQAQQLQQDVLLELLNWRSSTYQKHQTVSDSSAKAAVEQALWSLTLMTDDVQPSDLPRADEALALFRLYRGVLTSARFKTSTQSIQRRRAWRVQRSGSTGTTSVADTPRKRVAPLAGSSSASELAGFAGAERASPAPLSLDTTAAAAPASTPAVSAAEVEVDGFFATVETLCMLSRACYLAASMATAATSDGNDSTSAAVLAELLPASHTPMLTTLDASGPGHVASNSTMNVTAAAAAALASGGGGAKRAAVYDNVDMSKPYEPKVIPKTSTISHLLTRVVQQNILFRNFKSEEHASIVEAFECVTTKAGEIVIKQGDSGEYFYIIEQGKLDVFMESCGLRIKVGRTLGTGDYFGELALMYNTPRAATVVSTEASTLWRIDRTTYRSIVTHHNKITSDEYFQLVSNVTILGKRLGDVLSAAELSKVVSTLEIEEFEPDAVIIRQHATGDYFYIISEGQVDVFQEAHLATNGAGGAHDRDEERSVLGAKLATLTRGDCFGEKALLADDVRQASCVAVGRVVCLSLSRDDFIAMIGSWQDVTAAQDVQRLALAAKRAKIRASVYDSQYHLTINLDELERLNTLGEGAFGRVLVARHKNSGQLYALKCQAKAFICAQNMQEMVLNEVAIMKQLDHPLITKLHAVIQDRRYIYFLLELLPGGEFFSFLQTAGKLSEDKARFYAASVVLALDELHKAKIAYRDLKPENMVMDSRGYVKLVDFGLAKQVLSGSTWTMCGTPDYLAPEIILNKGHNHAVDYWALGVLVYEMIHGWPPFYHDSPMKVYEKIIMGKVDYPATFSKALEDIVSKFLVKNPSKRLGNVKGGISDITKHKWFGSFDWRGLMAGTLLAPVMPNLSAFDAAVAAGAEDEEEEENNEADQEQHQESDWMPELL